MLGLQTRFRWVVVAVLAAVLAFGCGQDGEDASTVYLHVFNAYPGANSADVIGESGLIASNLPFGERTEEPVAVDRSVGGELTLYLEGVPTEFDGDVGLYNLYPHETATLVIGHRSDAGQVEAGMLRHVQSGSTDCRLVVNNLLSLTNEALGNYNFILGWNLAQALEDPEGRETIAYNEAREQEELEQEDWRPNLYDDLEDHPYFALRPGGGGGDGAGDLIWLGPDNPDNRADFPRIDFSEGTVQTAPITDDYIDCIEEREALREELEDAAEEEDEEPDLSELEEFDCNAPVTYAAMIHEPATAAIEYIHYPTELGNRDPHTCGLEHQIYSDFYNIFEGEHGQQHSERLHHTTEFEPSDHYFLNVYGRPVNPLIESWRASDHFTEMPDYPGTADD